jgi:hypothetical protein
MQLTPKMLDTLMECHERELMNLPPSNAFQTSSVKGLIKRGFVKVKTYITESGKTSPGLYITESGRRILDKL